jgi:phosphoserine phosphatase
MAINKGTWSKPIIFLSFLFLLFTGCKKDDETNAGNYTLDRLNWSERNYQVLNQLIVDYGIGGKSYSKKETPYVVLDWDQTCAFLDVEETLLRYQLTNFRFKLSKEQFKSLLKDEINGVNQLPEDFHSINLKDINTDLIEEYTFLYDHYIGPERSMSLQEIKATPQYLDFLAKLPFLYDGYCETGSIGSEYAYPWVLFLLAGHTIDEVKNMAKEAISFELANGLFKQEWSSPTLLTTHSGSVNYTFKTGLRVLPEMQNLIETVTKHGIAVFIVSASYKPVVETFAAPGNFGYQVPAENVIAMELAVNANGVILPEYKTGCVKTVRQGKVEAINRVIKQQLGRTSDPLFAAGDSDGDYEMLTGFPGMKLALIWNRLKGGDIGKLCQKAVDELTIETPAYILQGRNENIGMAIPSSSTILYGKTSARLLP